MKNEIDVNIWDYYGDNCIPENEIQETFIYVESDNYTFGM